MWLSTTPRQLSKQSLLWTITRLSSANPKPLVHFFQKFLMKSCISSPKVSIRRFSAYVYQLFFKSTLVNQTLFRTRMALWSVNPSQQTSSPYTLSMLCQTFLNLSTFIFTKTPHFLWCFPKQEFNLSRGLEKFCGQQWVFLSTQ